MSEIDNLINDLFQNTENKQKKQELAGRVSFLSFDSIFDLLECLRNIPEGEQETVHRFKNTYAELYELRSHVLKFIFSTISGMSEYDLKILEEFLERGF